MSRNSTKQRDVQRNAQQNSAMPITHKGTQSSEPPENKSADSALEIDEKLRFLLQQKLTYLNTVPTVCMSWWVSSIVFCGTILASVWIKQSELGKSGILTNLSWVVALFFISFIVFGLAVIRYLCGLKGDISGLIGKLKPVENSEPTNSKVSLRNTYDREVNLIICGVGVGVFTFVLFLVVWIALIGWFI